MTENLSPLAKLALKLALALGSGLTVALLC